MSLSVHEPEGEREGEKEAVCEREGEREADGVVESPQPQENQAVETVSAPDEREGERKAEEIEGDGDVAAVEAEVEGETERQPETEAEADEPAEKASAPPVVYHSKIAHTLNVLGMSTMQLSLSCCTYAFAGLSVVAYLQEVVGYDEALASSVYSMMSVGHIVGGFVQSAAVARLGENWMFRINSGLGALCMYLLSHQYSHMPVYAVGAVLFLMQHSALLLAAGSFLGKSYPPQMRGTTFGIQNAGMFLGTGVFQVVAGHLFTKYPGVEGHTYVMRMFLGFQVFSALAAWVVRPCGRLVVTTTPTEGTRV
ncbi:major facilitator superfamily protein [Kipferlia bialata]|uniref:Major facilitator superfamily protein n=1 Tax=Kipferlia bialata TaxID=797122 RepID=A0A9K3GJG2_9EUKA|nr:major facilitator superfamily protein [Kipferlia bialata]|eukprot:g6881.t1